MNKIVRKMTDKTVLGCALALSATMAYSGTMGPAVSPGYVYLGVFGGGGAVSRSHITQHGTAFYPEDLGGPLAVDAFGSSQSSSFGMVGGHIGFAGPNNLGLYMPVTPALELEGYYVGGAKIRGHDLSNNTVRLPEHDFVVTYPLKTGVFLVNAVVNGNNVVFDRFKPYVGVGIGSALVSISGASAIQINPAEPGVNHYNSNPYDTAIAFAAQPKIGAHYDLSAQTSLFAEYRFLYVSRTDYTFGSTVAPGHFATAPWLASIKSQYYNMGTVGIDFDL